MMNRPVQVAILYSWFRSAIFARSGMFVIMEQWNTGNCIDVTLILSWSQYGFDGVAHGFCSHGHKDSLQVVPCDRLGDQQFELKKR